MIYFDNAATGGVKPENVVGAAAAAMRACANPGRSGHALSLACAERVQKVRGMLCEFFGAPSADRVIFTKNCTEALNIALLGCIKEGDKVVVMTHYPPLSLEDRENDVTAMLSRYGAKCVAYGHLHGAAIRYAFEGEWGGVQYHLVSCDALGFTLRLLGEEGA